MALSLSRVIAHRGASAYAPENTLAAFVKAAELGATWVEFDVMLAACGQAIIFHDETLERTTDGEGEVRDFTYAELKKLDAGGWFSPEFAGQKIPSLSELFDCLASHGLGANIEIKALPGQEEETAERVVTMIQNSWPSQCPKPLVSSFSEKSLRTARHCDPDLALGLLLEHWEADWQKLADDLQCHTVHLDAEIVTEKRVQSIAQSGRAILSYTVNEPKQAREFFAMGVDAVFTDKPDLILSC